MNETTNVTERFIYQQEQIETIYNPPKGVDSTTVSDMFVNQDVYINTLSNIHDIPSLIEFYQLMFAGNPLVLFTTLFIGLYVGCMLIEKRQKKYQSKGGEQNEHSNN